MIRGDNIFIATDRLYTKLISTLEYKINNHAEFQAASFASIYMIVWAASSFWIQKWQMHGVRYFPLVEIQVLFAPLTVTCSNVLHLFILVVASLLRVLFHCLLYH